MFKSGLFSRKREEFAQIAGVKLFFLFVNSNFWEN